MPHHHHKGLTSANTDKTQCVHVAQDRQLHGLASQIQLPRRALGGSPPQMLACTGACQHMGHSPSATLIVEATVKILFSSKQALNRASSTGFWGHPSLVISDISQGCMDHHQ
eukprot:4670751-Amphidinium_carterae.1